MDENYVRIQSGRVTLGQSSLEASGTLKDPQKPAAVQFNTTLALGELGRLLKRRRPPGRHGQGRRQCRRCARITITSSPPTSRRATSPSARARRDSPASASIPPFTADPHRIELAGPAADRPGRRLHRHRVARGDGAVPRRRQRCTISTSISWRAPSPASSLGYDGVISGPVQADGNIKNPSAIVARANLGIAPGRRGMPVTGQASTSTTTAAPTRSRSPVRSCNCRTPASISPARSASRSRSTLVSRDLTDFQPLGEIPVTLNNGGAATVNATVTGNLSAPQSPRRRQLTNFAAEGRPFDRLHRRASTQTRGRPPSPTRC